MADRAQTRVKDGTAWRIGTQADIEWMSDRTGNRQRITGAIPPVFADYAMLLDTGVSDIVFSDAPMVMLYKGWRYVLVLAGPDQAATWRPAPGGQSNWKSTELPDVMFPDDRAWLLSTPWDDD